MATDLTNRSPQLAVYSRSDAPGWFWVDDRAMARQRQMDSALRSMESQYGLDSPDDLPPLPGGWDGSGGDDPWPPAPYPAYSYPSNSFWLEIEGVTNNAAALVLHGTQPAKVYELMSNTISH